MRVIITLLPVFTVTEAWARIDERLALHSPATAAQLAPPARAEEIAAAEEKMGLKFPDDLVESLLCHNGVAAELTPLPVGMSPMSVERIVDYWEMNVGIQRDVGAGSVFSDNPWWHEKWIPFAAMGSDSQFIDARDGDIGRHWHDSGAESSEWISLQDYLAETAAALIDGGEVNDCLPYLDEDGELLWCEEDDSEGWGSELRRAPIGVE